MEEMVGRSKLTEWREGDVAVLIQMTETLATFWSNTLGLIACKTKEVRDENDHPIKDHKSVVPGTEAQIWNVSDSPGFGIVLSYKFTTHDDDESHPDCEIVEGNCRWAGHVRLCSSSRPILKLTVRGTAKNSVAAAYQMLLADTDQGPSQRGEQAPTVIPGSFQKEVPLHLQKPHLEAPGPSSPPPTFSVFSAKKPEILQTPSTSPELENRKDDCYPTYIRWNHGYLLSPSLGTIRFERRQLEPSSAGNIRQMIPGTLTSVDYVPLLEEETPRDDPNTPLYKATRIYPQEIPIWAPKIIRGRGRFQTVQKTYGIAKEAGSARKIFVPGWAGANNNAERWQIPQLQNVDIHFLAMPNPKEKYGGEPFAISVHPYGPSCMGPHGDEPAHWNYSKGPPTQEISRDGGDIWSDQTEDWGLSNERQDFRLDAPGHSHEGCDRQENGTEKEESPSGGLLIDFHDRTLDVGDLDDDQPKDSNSHREEFVPDLPDDDEHEEVDLGIWRVLNGTSTSTPLHGADPTVTRSLPDQKGEIRLALIRATAEFNSDTLVDLLRSCPTLFAWAYFGLSDTEPPPLILQREIRDLSRFNLP